MAATAVEQQTRVELIKYHEAEAERITANPRRAADKHRWEAARLITEEIDAGKTQREVADLIEKSHRHVGYMFQVHKRFGNHGSQDMPKGSFDSYYQRVKNETREERDQEVQKLTDEGHSNRVVGKKLGIDEKTVRGSLQRVQEVDAQQQHDERRGDGCGVDNGVVRSIEELRTDLSRVTKDLKHLMDIGRDHDFTTIERDKLIKVLRNALKRLENHGR